MTATLEPLNRGNGWNEGSSETCRARGAAGGRKRLEDRITTCLHNDYDHEHATTAQRKKDRSATPFRQRQSDLGIHIYPQLWTRTATAIACACTHLTEGIHWSRPKSLLSPLERLSISPTLRNSCCARLFELRPKRRKSPNNPKVTESCTRTASPACIHSCYRTSARATAKVCQQ